MKVAVNAMIIRSTGYNHASSFHNDAQELTSAMKIGQEMISKTKDPAIWPANVDVRKIMKKLRNNSELLLDFRMFFEKMDCLGKIKTRKPIIWNHMNEG